MTMPTALPYSREGQQWSARWYVDGKAGACFVRITAPGIRGAMTQVDVDEKEFDNCVRQLMSLRTENPIDNAG